MKRKIGIFYFLLFSNLSLDSLPAKAGTGGPQKIRSESVTHTSFAFFDVNRIGAWISNEGEFTSARPRGNKAGMEWPLGTGKYINYLSGIWVAGLVGGEVHIAAVEFSSDFLGGTYESYPDNPDTNRYRIYTIDDLSGPGDKDWDNWPAADGAPVDSNGDPLLFGDKMYWSVFHDADSAASDNRFSTDPLGIEVRMTIWGYDDPGILGDVMYINYQIFNMGDNMIDNAFVGLWADADVGVANNDLMGTDTLLQMVYTYDRGNDSVYDIAPPSIGMGLLQGLIIPSIGDTAVGFGRKIPDHTNSSLSAAVKFANMSGPSATDPSDSIEVYNYMKGLNSLGENKIDDLGNITRYWFTGDPVSGEGWIDSDYGDIRVFESFGPIDLAPGDSNEIIAAVVIGQGDSTSRGITELREKMLHVRTLHGILVGIEPDDIELPSDYRLSQNYPNPFNPLTNIQYSLPVRSEVRLVVYNLRGQEVARLVDGEERPAGVHNAVWDASSAASGLYFYRLTAGDYVKTRKMVLLK